MLEWYNWPIECHACFSNWFCSNIALCRPETKLQQQENQGYQSFQSDDNAWNRCVELIIYWILCNSSVDSKVFSKVRLSSHQCSWQYSPYSVILKKIQFIVRVVTIHPDNSVLKCCYLNFVILLVTCAHASVCFIALGWNYTRLLTLKHIFLAVNYGKDISMLLRYTGLWATDHVS